MVNNRKKTQVDISNISPGNWIGIVLVYNQNCKPYQEYINKEAIHKYISKHNLSVITPEEVIEHMIKHFNSTLREKEKPRHIIGIHRTYEVKYYIKTK